MIKDPEIAILTTAGWVLAGIMSIAFIYTSSPDLPDKKGCALYKVDKRPVTAYVLKPPPAEVVYKACPQVTKVEPAPEPEVVKQEEPKPRRHRRHRVRRYWK